MKVKFTILLLFMVVQISAGQSILQNMKNPVTKGNICFEHRDYEKALFYFQKALKEKPSDWKIKLQIAVCYNLLDQWENSIDWFEMIDEEFHPMIDEANAFHYGDALQHMGRVEEAVLWYQKARKSNFRPVTLQHKLDGIANLEKYYTDSANYLISSLPFNNDAAEFAPWIYNGGLIFTSFTPKQRQSIPKTREEIRYDLYYFPLTNDYRMSGIEGQFAEVNSGQHDGTLVVYDAGKQMIFTRNNRTNSKSWTEDGMKIKGLGLFHADFDSVNNIWTSIQPLNINHPDYSIGHPTISKDGKTLYFTSDMPGGYGGTDLYKSRLINGLWQAPVNLGSWINSDSDEMFPYLYEDSVLYFASEGHGGLGGMDIYKMNILPSHPSDIINLGYPINSSGDDFGIVLENKELSGYFTSNRINNHLRDNIFRFSYVKRPNNIPELEASTEMEIKKENFQGIVIDRETKQPMINAQVLLYGLSNRKVYELQSDSTGHFCISLPADEGVAIRVEQEDYYTYKKSLTKDSLVANHYYHIVEMDKIVVGQVFRLDNIYYSLDSYDLNNPAQKSLDKVVDLLKDNPKIKLELSSHTDSRGSDKYNMVLSQKRASTAANYIISKGIDLPRIKAIGYGESHLQYPCGDEVPCDEEQHLWNRRTEITILDN